MTNNYMHIWAALVCLFLSVQCGSTQIANAIDRQRPTVCR